MIKLIKNYFKKEYWETPLDFFLFKIVLPILLIIQIFILIYCLWGATTGQPAPDSYYVPPIIIVT